MWKANKAGLSLIVLGGFLAGMPKAQAQTDTQVSVAEAARRAREQKKDASKPATVITNDTLQPAPAAAPEAAGQGNAVNPAPAANGTPAAAPDVAANAQSTSAANTAAAETPQDKAEVKALKQQIAEMQLQVDVAQRALSLANEEYYSRPDISKDADGKAKLDALKSDLTEKQQALADLKAKLPADAAADEKSQPASESQSQNETQTPSDSQPQKP